MTTLPSKGPSFSELDPGAVAAFLGAQPFVVIRHVPDDPDRIVCILREFGTPLPSYQNPSRFYDEVRALPEPLRDPNGEPIQSTTSDEFFPHIDGAAMEIPYNYVALYCVRNDATGGDSVCIGSEHLLGRLDHEERTFFETTLYDFGTGCFPVITRDQLRPRIRFNLLHIRKAEREHPGSAEHERKMAMIERLGSLIAEMTDQCAFRLNAEDLLVIDNRGCLHGRRSFDADSGAREFRRFRTAAIAGA